MITRTPSRGGYQRKTSQIHAALAITVTLSQPSKVTLCTRKHGDGGIDGVSVIPNDCQSEAICSLLDGKSGKLLRHELGLQVNTILGTEPHKHLVGRHASPVSWDVIGGLYDAKQGDIGPVMDDILGRLFLKSPPMCNGEDKRKWFKAELESRKGESLVMKMGELPEIERLKLEKANWNRDIPIP